MRSGQYLATLLAVAMFSTTSLVGQQSTPPATNGQTTSTQINNPVWIKNPFNDSATASAQRSNPAQFQQRTPMQSNTGQRPQSQVIVNRSALPVFDNRAPTQAFNQFAITNPLRPAPKTEPVPQPQPLLDAVSQTKPQRTLNEFSTIESPLAKKQVVQSPGPLDHFVRETSATEEILTNPVSESPTVVPIKPVHADTNTQRFDLSTGSPQDKKRSPSQRNPQSNVPTKPASVLINSENNQPFETVKLEPYAHTPHGDPTSHIHEEARMARENFDPALCNRKPANNPDISGCYDEWGNFCRPKRLDWECDCRQFPRREAHAGCTKCQTNRRGNARGQLIGHGRLAQGLRNLACGCKGNCTGRCQLNRPEKTCNQEKAKGCSDPDCSNPDCGCRKGLRLFGAGLFKSNCGSDCSADDATEFNAPRFDFGNTFSAMPRGLGYNSCGETPNLFAALKTRSGTKNVNTYTPASQSVCSDCLTERVVSGTRCTKCRKSSGGNRFSLVNIEVNKGCCTECGDVESDCGCEK